MARLTSLASVLTALDSPEDGPRPRQERYRGPSANGAPWPGDATIGFAPPAPPGYRIYQSARKQARFYTAYAEMLEPGRRSRSGRRPLRGRRGGGGDAWVRETYPEGSWVGPATLATAYRQAAQFAALVDSRWATKLAARAAVAYASSGLPFGLFLAAGLLSDDELADDGVFQAMVEPFRDPDGSDAIRHPVQQAYLLLAGSRPLLREPLSQALFGAEQRLRAHGLYAIGPQRVPLGDYLDLAASMSHDAEAAGLGDTGSSAIEIAGRLARLQRTQANALRAARRNRYAWQRADGIIDLENVALSGVALRHRPWFGELSAAITVLVSDDELAELPVWAMEQVQAGLSEITGSVTGILREPERAWRREEFLEPDTVTDPWPGQARPDATGPRPDAPTSAGSPPGRRDEAPPATRPDLGLDPWPDAGPDTRPYQGPGHDLGYYPDEETGDDPDDGDEGDDGGPYPGGRG
jgi:hypothetical protein